MKTLATIGKHLLLTVVYLIGTALFIMIVGEQAPDSNISSDLFFAMKFAAIFGAVLLYYVCRFLYHSNAFPRYIYDWIERQDNDENEFNSEGEEL